VSRYGILTDDGGKTYRGLEGVNNFSEANIIFGNFENNWYNPYNEEKESEFKPPGTLADAVNRLFSPQYSDTWGTFASTKWFAESAQNVSTGYLSLEYIHNNVHVSQRTLYILTVISES
jgi:tyrosinase